MFCLPRLSGGVKTPSFPTLLLIEFSIGLYFGSQSYSAYGHGPSQLLLEQPRCRIGLTFL